MEISNDRNYIIIDAREISILDFSQFLESKDTVVYNSDSTKSIVKYTGSAPSYSFTYPTSGPYTRDGLKAAQSESEWPHGDV
ncbi:MAG: hypothetical protein VXB01_13930 [Opitutae bacterium]